MQYLDKQQLKYDQYQITLTPLDQYCNSFNISITHSQTHFQDTINLYDIISIKQILKKSSKISDINKMTILFLKLMISQQIKSKSLKIIELSGIIYEKVIKNMQKLKGYMGKGEVKGLGLVLRQDLIMVIPRVYNLVEMQYKWNSKQRQQQIKQIFYDGKKQLKKK